MNRMWVILLALLMVSPVDAFAGRSKRDKKTDAKTTKVEAAKKEKGPFKPFDEVTKDMERHQGFFDIYEKLGALMMAVPKDRLDEDFLMTFEVAQGLARFGVNSGSMLDWEGRIVAFEKHGKKLYLVHKPHRFVASGENEQQVVAGSFGSSIIQSADIKAVRKKDDAYLIDVQKWFVSDMSGVGNWLRFAVSRKPGQPGRVQLDKSRSFVEYAKVFPKNINVRTKLTFKPGQPINMSSVPDSRYLPVSVYCVMTELPVNPMEPRLADDRVGYFLTVHKDYSQQEKTFFKRYVRKWRLEKGKKHGKLYAPKKPIIYYLDRNIPPRYRSYIQSGIEEWNAAFETAGFKNAIQADLMPRDADPEDIRYATIRWMASDQGAYLAIGPSVVDPRTGEVLDADVLIDAVFPLRVANTWRNVVDPAGAIEAMFEDPTPNGHNAMTCGLSGMGDQLAMQAGLVRATLLASSQIAPGEPIPEAFVGEFLKFITMHEVGHTLGLRHNFRGSTDTPMAKLHDRLWTAENGLVNSVMEYPAANVASNGEANGHWYTTTVGTYDHWAIAYGYTPDAERAKSLAREVALDGHLYGTDEDARGAGALDPTVNIWDLGEDPLEWGIERAEIVRGLWQDLPANVLVDDAPRYELTNALLTLIGAYGQSLVPAVKYLGGQQVNRDHVGDPEARSSFVAVPREKQLRALKHLTDNAFSETAFSLPSEVLTQLGAQRWSHWGSRNTFRGRIDLPMHEIVLSIQGALLRQMLHPFRFARISDSEAKFGAENVLTIPEMISAITDAVWSELDGNSGNIESTRRNLQRLYVDQMTTMLTNPPERLPADARSITRMELKQLRGRILQAAKAGNLNDYTKAHLDEAQARINKALEASLVEVSG